MSEAYIPNVMHGRQIYEEIDIQNGANINFYDLNIINKYTWADFTDLVQYERDAGYQPMYSAMLAVILMKNKFRQKFTNLKDLSYTDEPTAIRTFLNENFIRISEKIPDWDISKGVYFDKYYELYINDAVRAVAKEVNSITNVPRIEVIVGENNKKKTITKLTPAASLDLEINAREDEYSAQDRLAYIAYNAANADISLNLDDYSSPEEISIKREVFKEKASNGFYKTLQTLDKSIENKDFKLAMNKNIATTMTFLQKFLKGDMKHNKLIMNNIEPMIKNTFLSAIVTKKDKNIEEKQEKLNSEYELDFEFDETDEAAFCDTEYEALETNDELENEDDYEY